MSKSKDSTSLFTLIKNQQTQQERTTKMKYNSKKTTTAQYIEQFAKALESANLNIKKMGEIYAAALMNDRSAGAEFAKRWPNMSPSRWELLRLIGRGDVGPSIWIMSDKVATAVLRLREKDRNILLSCAKDGVDVVGIRTGRVKKIRLNEINQVTLPVLMDLKSGHLRTTDEQREFLRKRQAGKNREAAASLPYLLSDGCVEILRKCKLMKSELRDMLIHLCGGLPDAVEFVAATRDLDVE